VGRAIQDSKQRTLVTSATVNWDLRDLFRIFMYESPEGERPDVRFRTATMTVVKEIMARVGFDAHVRHEVTTRGATPVPARRLSARALRCHDKCSA